MKSSFYQSPILWICALALSLSLIALAIGRVRDFERKITVLEEMRAELQVEIQRKEAINSALKLELSEIKVELDRLYRPQQIKNPAEFPISRVLARLQDTVASLAERENTSSEVIYELNPWLKGTSELSTGQAVWIPNP